MVELVIKIDEDVFARLFDNGIQDNEISVDDICEMARALRMGTPLEEELEKIREKFQKHLKESIKDSLDYTVGIAKGIEIIDNHIEELKGDI